MSPIGSFFDVSKPTTLGDYYDPIKAEQAKEQSLAQMMELIQNKKLRDIQLAQEQMKLEEAQQQKQGLSELMGNLQPTQIPGQAGVPSRPIPQGFGSKSGQIPQAMTQAQPSIAPQTVEKSYMTNGVFDILKFVGTPEGGAWAKKYSQQAADLMDKAGVFGSTAGGTSEIPITEDNKQTFVNMAATPEVRATIDSMEPGDILKPVTKGNRIVGATIQKESWLDKYQRLQSKLNQGKTLTKKEQADLNSAKQYQREQKVNLPADKETMLEDRYAATARKGILPLMAEGRILPPSSSFRPQYMARLMEEIEDWNLDPKNVNKQINPNLIKAVYDSNRTAMTQINKLAQGAKIAATNVENQINTLLKPVVNKLSDLDITWLNGKIRGLNVGVGSVNAANFYALLSEIVPEYAKVMQGTGSSVVAPTDAAMELANKLLSPGATVAQLKSNMKIMEKSLGIRLKSYDNTISSLTSAIGSGTPPPPVSEPTSAPTGTNFVPAF